MRRIRVSAVIFAIVFAAAGFYGWTQDCRAQGVCASRSCLADAECGSVTCRCGKTGPGPEGVCVVR